MNDVLNYLIEQREERSSMLTAFNEAVAELEAAKNKVAAFGDMSKIETEIERIDALIETVAKQNAGGIEEETTEEVADDGEVTEEQEA